MILAILMRSRQEPDKAPWTRLYYLCHHYKDIFDALGVTLFPVCSENCANEVCRICDGLVIPGSVKNVYPEHYGRVRTDENTYSEDEYSVDKPVVEAFVKAGKPILGICAGIQVLNVFFGGTLVQRVCGHSADNDPCRHTVHIAPDSFISRVYGADSALVNSYHGQCVDDVASGFRITARAEDGTIEAIEKGNIIAVQWHPEVDFEMDLFRGFLKEFF